MSDEIPIREEQGMSRFLFRDVTVMEQIDSISRNVLLLAIGQEFTAGFVCSLISQGIKSAVTSPELRRRIQKWEDMAKASKESQ